MIAVKRVYDTLNDDDGYTVLVDRLWPRGIKKADLRCDEWLKAVAPSAELRKALHAETIDFAHFEQRYRVELENNSAFAELQSRVSQQKVTLLTAVKRDQPSHITVLQTLLN